MEYSSAHIERLIEGFAKLPGIGRKTAQRLTFHVLRMSQEEASSLVEAIKAVKENVGYCKECGNISESQPCNICRDENRVKGQICVVEQPGDVIAIEKTGMYKGQYFVLGGALSPQEGVGPEDLRIDKLVEKVARNGIEEVVVATNPNAQGETTAFYLSEALSPTGAKVTRIARGVPMGSDLEYSDQSTLARSLEGRKEMS
jgi:recombination protein RecR